MATMVRVVSIQCRGRGFRRPQGQVGGVVDVELARLKFARRVRNAWELRGRRGAFAEIALWLDAHHGK